MAGTASEESAGGRSLEGLSSGQRCQSGEVLAEWRSCEQMENGTPSTSPPYWDTDDSDDDGPKPAELYGKHTWKIEKFSQINKRELRSNAFEVGGYKWYILIYPQGCDVSNHLSLFLCVANHDKLLPGWSHFAQFTIAVVNKDPKKSKYSDTLHRFWKKEHDWGWKKFMELTKISDGFVDSDTLIIKAQVQVIREKADRPFRCLDCQYRRELVRVYLTNVEQICRRFVEDRRSKLGKLLEDNDKWSSFCSFWLGIDQNARRRMSREKMDMILKVIVKQFFIEKEVTSTLVMDSLYSGLKALEGQSKCIKGKARLTDGEDMPAPVVRVEKNMFVLVDDVLLLLERAAMEPLPPKDEKGPQNRTKDGSAGDDFNKDSIERDERRLTELGRRTVEIFVLAHIFSNKIEAAYQEAVALKRQEELIREEKAESEQKAKRGMAEKEKKSKKKQAKQKRNRKAKDVKLKDERADLLAEDKGLNDNAVEDDKVVVESRNTVEKDDILEDASDVSDLVDYGADNLQPDSEDRDVSPVNWDTDASEVNTNNEANCMRACNGILTVQYGVDKRNSSTMDDSSSTCSTDSAPSVVTNGSYRVNASTNNNKSQKSPTRAKNQRGKVKSRDMNGTNGVDNQRSDSVVELERRGDVSPSQKAVEASGSEAVVSSSQESMKFSEHNIVKKVEEVVVLQRRPAQKSQVENDRQSKEKASMVSHSPVSPPKCTVTAQHKYEPKIGASTAVHLTSRKTTSDSVHQQIEKPTGSCNMPQTVNVLKPDSVRTSLAKPTEKPSPRQQAPPSLISRPASAPIIPGTRQGTVPVVSVAPALQNPQLGRSASVTTQSAPDPSPSSSAHSFVPQSYRNAIVGSNLGSSSGLSHPPVSSLSSMSNQPTTPSSPAPSPSPSPSSSPSVAMSQQPAQSAGPYYVSQNYDRLELGSVGSRISFGASARDVVVQNGGRRQWLESQQQHRDANSTRNMTYDPPLSMLSNEIGNLDIYTRPISTTPNSRSYEYLRSSDFSASTSGAQPTQQGGGLADDDFPHIDIINELLDDEQGFASGPANLQNHRFPSYQSDMDISGDLGPSPYGSCRFERSRSYHDDFLQPDQYAGSSLQGNHYDSLRDYLPQGNTMMPYLNGQIDGLVPNQWQVGGTDHLSMLNNMSSNGGNGDGYPYNIQEYSNLASGLNGGYTMFRPSSGH